MIPTWKTHLEAHAAVIENGCVQHFGEPADELAAAATGSVFADLSQLGVIAFTGEETTTFLQGQLTNDMRELHSDTAQWNGYCSPKGRMLGNFLMWRAGDDTCMQLSGDILPSVLKRLSMFVMRAKTRARDASDEAVRLVVNGSSAVAAVTEALGVIPVGKMKTVATERGTVVRVGDDAFVLVLAPESAPAVWDVLTRHARPVGAPVWDWLRLSHGIPMIVAATQEAFVPQMVNYEALGGVSFQKGCYPGQEIVARSQYLGKMKRRMVLAHVNDAAAPGDSLYSDDFPGQATGTVVNAAPAPGGGYDLLAVAQIESAAKHSLHLKADDGPVLTLRALPYSLPE